MHAHLELYALGHTIFHRMDARWKLVAIALALASAILLQSIAAAGPALGGAVLLLLLSRLPPGWMLIRLGAVAGFLSLLLILLPLTAPGDDLRVGPVSFSARGLEMATLISLKALTVVSLVLFLFSTSPFEVTLKAAHALRLPSRAVQLLMLTYRYVGLLTDELDKLRIALKVRGFRNRAALHSYRTIGNVTGTMLIRSYERAERVAQAMRCRGFDGVFRAIHTFETRLADIVLFLFVIALTSVTPLLIEWLPR